MIGKFLFIRHSLCGWRNLDRIGCHIFQEAVVPDTVWERETPVVVVDSHVFEPKIEPFGPMVVRVLSPGGLFWTFATELPNGDAS